MGTSHAQFGNMLVLSAVYMSKLPWLNRLVTSDELSKLIARGLINLSKF